LSRAALFSAQLALSLTTAALSSTAANAFVMGSKNSNPVIIVLICVYEFIYLNDYYIFVLPLAACSVTAINLFIKQK
jgi:hypothetical protein